MNPISKWTTEANTLCAILIDEISQADTWERMIACGDAIRHVRREEKLHQAESDHLGCYHVTTNVNTTTLYGGLPCQTETESES